MQYWSRSAGKARLLLVWICLTLVVVATGLASATLQPQQQDALSAPIQVSYVHDAAVQTAQDAAHAAGYQPLPPHDAVLGYGLGTVWFKIALQVQPGYRLHLAAPFLDDVEFYQLDDNGQVQAHLATGDSLPWSALASSSDGFVFTPTPSGRIWLVKVRNVGGTFFPVRYSDASHHMQQQQRQQLIQGFFYGILLFAAVITLLFGMVSRDDSLGWFALLVLAITAVQAELQGFTQHWLWPAQPQWNHLIDLGLPLALWACCGFVVRYFQLARATLWQRMFQWLQGAALLVLLAMICTMLLDQYLWQSQLKQLCVLLMPLYAAVCLLTGLAQLPQQRPRALQFLLPMLVLFSSILTSAAHVLGLLADNRWTVVSLELGTTCAAVLMAISLVLNEYLAKDTLARTQKALLDRNVQLSQLQQAELQRSKISPFYGLGSRLALSELLDYQLRSGNQRYRLLLVEWQSYDRIDAALGRQKTQQILQTYLSHLQQYCARHAGGLVSLGPELHQTIYALNHDKIALLVQDSEFSKVLNAIRRLLHQKYRLDGLAPDFRPRYSSILLSTEFGADAEELMAKASLTLAYVQRDAGHLSYQTSFGHDSRQRLQLVTDLAKAISQAQFELVYQPIMELNSQRCIALEACVRWPHPTQGIISPALFIPLAEEAGLMTMITAWVYKEARRMANELQQQGFHVPVSVNLSGYDLQNPRLIGQLLQHELQYPAAQRLWLEVAESAVDTRSAAVQRCIGLLKKTNTQLIMDDFGAGESMLTKLGSLPLQAIKLDMALLSLLDSQKERILAGAIELARKLQLRVICEGVETQQQLTFLLLHNVDAAQGYFLAKPMAANRVAPWLAQQTDAAQQQA